MGVENFTFTAVKKGAATILKVSGEHMGALIGRRGETMESLSYLASLVVNRMEGPYVKLGLDVGGYRNKREDDLSALARRIADRVIRTGCYYEMEPMNPYERHIIHTAIADIEGVRSESKGEGPARHVVLYSTDPNACNLPDRDNARNQRGGRRDGGRGPRRDNRGGRGPRGPREGGREAPLRRLSPPRQPWARATAARAPACPPASLPTARVTRMPSRWHPKPPSASTTVTISPLVRSSFKQIVEKSSCPVSRAAFLVGGERSARPGRRGFAGASSHLDRSPSELFPHRFPQRVENSYFSTVHNRLYMGQK